MTPKAKFERASDARIFDISSEIRLKIPQVSLSNSILCKGWVSREKDLAAF